MIVEPLGDQNLIVRDIPMPAWQWAALLNEACIEGLIEAYASYQTVGLEIDPARFKWESVADLQNPSLESVVPKTHVIPVCYELGEDLEDVANRLKLANEDLVGIHASATYRCEAVGFCPGFPYLSGLDSRLHGIPRRASPRPHIIPGSVAITGSQCGVYPLPRPGGWAILGRTPLQLVHVEDRYFPIQAGDLVRFERIQRSEFDDLKDQRL